jgi:hypothetical protein
MMAESLMFLGEKGKASGRYSSGPMTQNLCGDGRDISGDDRHVEFMTRAERSQKPTLDEPGNCIL